MDEHNSDYSGDKYYKPLKAWEYFGYTLLYSIPVIGIILLIVNSINDDNINKRNHARSFWLIYIFNAVIGLISFITCFSFFYRYFYPLFH